MERREMTFREKVTGGWSGMARCTLYQQWRPEHGSGIQSPGAHFACVPANARAGTVRRTGCDFLMTLIEGAQTWMDTLATRPDRERLDRIRKMLGEAKERLHQPEFIDAGSNIERRTGNERRGGDSVAGRPPFCLGFTLGKIGSALSKIFDAGVAVREALSICRTRRKPQAFEADAASLWILNQSLLIINELELYDAKPRLRTYPAHKPQYGTISVRGACGFVLTAYSVENHLLPIWNSSLNGGRVRRSDLDVVAELAKLFG